MLTAEQVIALAPDPSSAKSGRDLATRRKWVSVGRSGETALWGECQGSGASPYQTQVDLGEPAFKCSCPSRKFPCKHGIGLLLLAATDPSAFVEGDPPTWVASWLASRSERAEKQAVKKAEEAEKPVDAAAQAKRAAQREERVQAGLDDLEQFLRDLVRRGLANVDLGYKFWDNAAARLVDSQAPGLARLVREMSGIPSTGAGWQDCLVERAGLLYLAVQGYRRLAESPFPWRGEGQGEEGFFPDGAQADLRTVVGWNYPQEEVLAGEGVADRWSVLAQYVEEDERLQVQRTWLRGRSTGRDALILQFAHPSQGFQSGGDAPLIPGSSLNGELAFFPSAYPLRALVKSRSGEPGDIDMRGYATIDAAVDAYGRAVAKFPWLNRFPVTLDAVTPVRSENSFPSRFGRGAEERGGVGSGWKIVDANRQSLTISPRSAANWRLLAVSGGHPVSLSGEWNGTHFLPLAAFAEGRYAPLQ